MRCVDVDCELLNDTIRAGNYFGLNFIHFQGKSRIQNYFQSLPLTVGRIILFHI